MKTYDLDSIRGKLTRSAVTIGMFDGVHLGHRALLDALLDEARRIHGQSVILTFDRHPAATVRPDRAPKFISSLDQRVAALQATGVDFIVVSRFDQATAEMPPRRFFEEVLVDKLKAAVVVVGPDFRFGKGRTGSFALLAEMGVEHGIAAVAISAVRVDDAPISSTRIRTLLRHGAVADAARLLGRPFVLEGAVVRGAGLGVRLGFPTANLSVDPGQVVPADGVYLADVAVGGRLFLGLVSIGSRPTVGPGGVVVEVYIIDFEEDIYCQNIRIGFREWLREQRKFPGLDQLVQQMWQDLDTALRLGVHEILH